MSSEFRAEIKLRGEKIWHMETKAASDEAAADLAAVHERCTMQLAAPADSRRKSHLSQSRVDQFTAAIAT
jgi:hypothetical protein